MSARCLTCNSCEVTGVCATCKVATYCSAECADRGISEHRRDNTCARYAALLALDATAAPFGYPAYLERTSEVMGFGRFTSARESSIDGAEGAPLPIESIADLMDQIWSQGLTAAQRLAWGEAAKKSGLSSGRAAFDADRRAVIEEDFEHTYPNDTRAKQIWRCLAATDRVVYVKTARGEETDSGPVAKTARTSRTFQSVADKFVSDGVVTRELVSLISEGAPALSVIRMTAPTTPARDATWELLFMRDFEEPASETPSGRALLESVRAKLPQGTYVQQYREAFDRLVDEMASEIKGALVKTTNLMKRMLFYIADPKKRLVICHGATFDRSSGASEDTAELFNVRHADDLDIDDDNGRHMDYEDDPAAAEKQLVKSLKREPFDTQRSVMATLVDVLDQTQLALYEPFFLGPYVVFSDPDEEKIYTPKALNLIDDMNASSLRHSFGFDGENMPDDEFSIWLTSFVADIVKYKSAHAELVMIEADDFAEAMEDEEDEEDDHSVVYAKLAFSIKGKNVGRRLERWEKDQLYVALNITA